MYLQTKLANPHFKPEVAAQTTLVNFCVTEVGLEEQLLALASHMYTIVPDPVSCVVCSSNDLASHKASDLQNPTVQVVAHERPDLQEQAASLSTQLASYTITLKELEDNLLQRLAASQVGLDPGLTILQPARQPKQAAVVSF